MRTNRLLISTSTLSASTFLLLPSAFAQPEGLDSSKIPDAIDSLPSVKATPHAPQTVKATLPPPVFPESSLPEFSSPAVYQPTAALPSHAAEAEPDPCPSGPCPPTLDTTARLYGQETIEATPLTSATDPSTDPLATLTDEEWVTLLVEEPADVPDEALATSPASPIAEPIAEPIAHPTNPITNPAPVLADSSPPVLDPPQDSPLDADPPADPPPTVSPLLPLDDSLQQLTSVSQLSDVQPTDWAYQALQSLVERYGIVAGYPDGSFQGDRPLSRYEFAATLNAALDQLTQIIPVPGADPYVTQADLLTLQRLQDDFAMELATLSDRVDDLEARVATLEAQSFSTTLQLNGQVTLALADAWGGDPPGLGQTNPVFTSLTQLQLSGSFSGTDQFRINLSAGTAENGGFAQARSLNTNTALLGFQSDTNADILLDSLEYRFAAGDRLVVTVKPAGFGLDSVLTPNSLYASSSTGALSRFAGSTPLFKIGNLDAGAGIDWLVSDRVRLQAAYGVRNPGDGEQGLFASESRALGVQLLLRPTPTVTTGLAYVNAFNQFGFLDTFTGSNNADTSGGFLEPATIHAFSGTLQWQITPDVVFGAWGGVTLTDALPSDAYALSTTYLFSLGFPNTFGREGDLLAVMVGQPFRLREGINILREDEGSGLHYEVFYRFRLNDSITLVPGVFVVTEPGHVTDNDPIVVGALRTVFRF